MSQKHAVPVTLPESYALVLHDIKPGFASRSLKLLWLSTRNCSNSIGGLGAKSVRGKDRKNGEAR